MVGTRAQQIQHRRRWFSSGCLLPHSSQGRHSASFESFPTHVAPESRGAQYEGVGALLDIPLSQVKVCLQDRCCSLSSAARCMSCMLCLFGDPWQVNDRSMAGDFVCESILQV